MSSFEPAVCNSVDSRGVAIELDGIPPSFAVSLSAVLSCVATGLTVTKWEVVGMAAVSTGLAGMTENDRPSEPVGDTVAVSVREPLIVDSVWVTVGVRVIVMVPV